MQGIDKDCEVVVYFLDFLIRYKGFYLVRGYRLYCKDY